MNKNIITEEGYQLIKKRISELERESKEIADKLSYARLDGDLSENADWIILRENLEKSHDKINKLRQILEDSEIIKKKSDSNLDIVQIGNKVAYFIIEDDKKTKERFEVEITSDIESDPSEGRISYQSPLGSALLEKRIGDTPLVKSSSTEYKVRIISIE